MVVASLTLIVATLIFLILIILNEFKILKNEKSEKPFMNDSVLKNNNQKRGIKIIKILFIIFIVVPLIVGYILMIYSMISHTYFNH